MEVIKFFTKNLLRPVFSGRPAPPANLTRRTSDIIDLDGPKLIHGSGWWLTIFQLVGSLNIQRRPLALAMAYKLLLVAAALYLGYEQVFVKLQALDLISNNYKNPIFIFIALLASLTVVMHFVCAFYMNLFNLCPMFKILTTEKLCFIDLRTQRIFGDKIAPIVIVFYGYTTVLVQMLASDHLEQFVCQFSLLSFLKTFAFTVVVGSQIYAMVFIDLYIRLCFACWLLGTKHNYEQKLAQFHSSGWARVSELPAEQEREQEQEQERAHSADKRRLLALDEIQKRLNNMDDHLEVWRTIQTATYVLNTLNAFLIGGALLLIAYNLLANMHDLYHGLLLLMLTVNVMIVIFSSYIGDRLVFYALERLVQLIEDEYFLQDSNELNCAAAAAGRPSPVGSPIDKKDVLFCREFLHQFENHLATPWTKLTVKTHLHMIGTFVTLIAAQIIFDSH